MKMSIREILKLFLALPNNKCLIPTRKRQLISENDAIEIDPFEKLKCM